MAPQPAGAGVCCDVHPLELDAAALTEDATLELEAAALVDDATLELAAGEAPPEPLEALLLAVPAPPVPTPPSAPPVPNWRPERPATTLQPAPAHASKRSDARTRPRALLRFVDARTRPVSHAGAIRRPASDGGGASFVAVGGLTISSRAGAAPATKGTKLARLNPACPRGQAPPIAFGAGAILTRAARDPRVDRRSP
jgi:hypothetical protein